MKETVYQFRKMMTDGLSLQDKSKLLALTNPALL